MEWKTEHCVICVEHYSETSSLIDTQRVFPTIFNIFRNKSVPHHKSILICVAPKKKEGPPVSARTPDKIEQLRQFFNRNLRFPARKRALLFNMFRKTLWRVLHIDL